MEVNYPLLEFIIKLILSCFLGGIIGLERKISKHYGVGFRTSALITLSSCSFTIAGIYFFDATNIARIIQGLAAGIGFIGGAIIWKQLHDHAVYGITTAVIVWFLTALGIIIGIGLYLEAIILTIFVLIVLLLKRFGIE